MWEELCKPRPALHDLDTHTPLYVDCHIALELLHMRYPDYTARTTPVERLLYRLYLALKGAKDHHAMERSQQEAEMQRNALRAVAGPPTRA